MGMGQRGPFIRSGIGGNQIATHIEPEINPWAQRIRAKRIQAGVHLLVAVAKSRLHLTPLPFCGDNDWLGGGGHAPVVSDPRKIAEIPGEGPVFWRNNRDPRLSAFPSAFNDLVDLFK